MTESEKPHAENFFQGEKAVEEAISALKYACRLLDAYKLSPKCERSIELLWLAEGRCTAAMKEIDALMGVK